MGKNIVGYTLVWFGVIALLKGLGVIRFVDWSIIWPVILIVAGLSIKHCKHDMMCPWGGRCGMCDNKVSDHKCEGPDCATCKVK